MQSEWKAWLGCTWRGAGAGPRPRTRCGRRCTRARSCHLRPCLPLPSPGAPSPRRRSWRGTRRPPPGRARPAAKLLVAALRMHAAASQQQLRGLARGGCAAHARMHMASRRRPASSSCAAHAHTRGDQPVAASHARTPAAACQRRLLTHDLCSDDCVRNPDRDTTTCGQGNGGVGEQATAPASRHAAPTSRKAVPLRRWAGRAAGQAGRRAVRWPPLELAG